MCIYFSDLHIFFFFFHGCFGVALSFYGTGFDLSQMFWYVKVSHKGISNSTKSDDKTIIFSPKIMIKSKKGEERPVV